MKWRDWYTPFALYLVLAGLWHVTHRPPVQAAATGNYALAATPPAIGQWSWTVRPVPAFSGCSPLIYRNGLRQKANIDYTVMVVSGALWISPMSKWALDDIVQVDIPCT